MEALLSISVIVTGYIMKTFVSFEASVLFLLSMIFMGIIAPSQFNRL